MMIKLDKIDKVFLITVILLILPFLLFCVLFDFFSKFEIYLLTETLFILFAINFIFVVPLCFIAQIITFIIKLFAKNKNKKDWFILLLNIFIIVFGGYFLLLSYGVAIVL